METPFSEEEVWLLLLGMCLLKVLFLLLYQCIELFLLIIIQRATDLVDGALADGVDLLNLVIAGYCVVLHHVHGLGVLVFQSGLHFGLLVGGKIQLLRQRLHLIVDAGTSGNG